MKYILALLLTSILLVIGCNTATKSGLFSVESMAPEQFSINTDRDTTLQTKNGALIQILKGALSADGGIATLEIKEAYNIQQMIKAGLTTNSNGDPLSSGGMIYINAAGGQKITFNQPVKIAIPADRLEKDMQLFKGEKDKNGNINWTNPVPLPENKQLTAIERGKVLFQQKCGSCHALGKTLTGPDLAHFPKRFPYGEENDIYYSHFSDHIRYSQIDSMYHLKDHIGKKGDKSWSSDHHIAYLLYKCNMNFVALGQIFESDSINYLRDIYNYIQNESDRLDLPMPPQTYLKNCVDSCILYNERIGHLRKLKTLNEKEREKLVKENGLMVDDTSRPPNQSTLPFALPDFDEKVSPQNFEAEYYQFTIESFGWFNIDILLKDINGVEESELLVRIIGEYRKKVEVYLIIPSMKVYGEGGITGKREDEYAFDNKNGKIPLPQNAKGWILAMTETNTNIAFALREFTTMRQQSFEISLQQSTMDKFNAAIQSFGLDELNIKVKETKNAQEIRNTDLKLKEIEKEIKNAEGLKPKGCDCDCLTRDALNKVAPSAIDEGLPEQ